MSITREARVRLGAIAALSIVFAGGVAVGFAFDRAVEEPAVSAEDVAVEEPKKTDPPPNGWIIDRIEMSQEQRSQVDSVLHHYGKRMMELQKAFHPRFRSLVDSTNQAVRAILDEEQLARYDALELERKQGGSQTEGTTSQEDGQ